MIHGLAGAPREGVGVGDVQAQVAGRQVQLPGEAQLEKEAYFEWEPSKLIGEFKTTKIRGGILQSFNNESLFSEVETHIDTELFLFLEGTAIMPFVDLVDGKPVMKSMQIVRILSGTQITIPPGKGHFVPIPEDNTPLKIIVIAPEMGDIMIDLPEPIKAIF